MKRIVTNVLAGFVVASGGLYLAATPAAASTGSTQATCGPLSGECCSYNGSTCACGPCSVIVKQT